MKYFQSLLGRSYKWLNEGMNKWTTFLHPANKNLKCYQKFLSYSIKCLILKKGYTPFPNSLSTAKWGTVANFLECRLQIYPVLVHSYLLKMLNYHPPNLNFKDLNKSCITSKKCVPPLTIQECSSTPREYKRGTSPTFSQTQAVTLLYTGF